MNAEHEDYLFKLYDRLIFVINKKDIIKKGFNRDTIISDLLKLSKAKLQSIMSSSADFLGVKNEYLINNDFVHLTSNFPPDKYALTFKGIIYAIRQRYNVSIEDQYLAFLMEIDSHYQKGRSKLTLIWKEKLAALTLILSASTSESSAIKFLNNNTTNQEVFLSALYETLSLLEKYKILKESKKERKLPNKNAIRGESPAQFFMRMEGGKDLSGKTNQIFMRTESGYFLDIEKNEEIDGTKLSLLLNLIFNQYDPEINYTEFKDHLLKISEKIFPAFLSRNVNHKVYFHLTNKLESYFNQEIWSLPHKM